MWPTNTLPSATTAAARRRRSKKSSASGSVRSGVTPSWTARKALLLACSYLFYAAWNPFFVLLIVTRLAGVPGLARPMSPLDYADAMLSSFVMVFLFTLWVARRIDLGSG